MSTQKALAMVSKLNNIQDYRQLSELDMITIIEALRDGFVELHSLIGKTVEQMEEGSIIHGGVPDVYEELCNAIGVNPAEQHYNLKPCSSCGIHMTENGEACFECHNES